MKKQITDTLRSLVILASITLVLSFVFELLAAVVKVFGDPLVSHL